MSAHLVGLAIIALPLLIIDFFFLVRQNKPVFFFGLALTVVGLGYLATTPAPAEIAQAVFGTPEWITQ